MEFTEIARDLKVIRQTMESSLRYTNIPAAAHFTAGRSWSAWLLGHLLRSGKRESFQYTPHHGR